MSVFRQQTAMVLKEHTACIKEATTDNDVDLLDLSLRLEKPTLIGLDGQMAIIKPYVVGDEALSFEALYDTCITLTDLQKMKRARVSSPDEIPLGKFRVDLMVAIDGVFDIPLALLAANHGDVRKRLKYITNNDPLFHERLHEALNQAIRRDGGELVYRIRDCSELDEPVIAGTPNWAFLTW